MGLILFAVAVNYDVNGEVEESCSKLLGLAFQGGRARVLTCLGALKENFKNIRFSTWTVCEGLQRAHRHADTHREGF